MKYSIKATNIEITQAIRDHIDERVKALDKYYDKVIMARIEIGMPSTHHHKGEIFRAEVNVQVPGSMIRLEVSHEDMYTAIDQLSRKMKRELIKFKDKHSR